MGPERVLGQVSIKTSTRIRITSDSENDEVVTGASEGIGREFALQLAKKGFNVLIAARNTTSLNNLAEEIGMRLA